MLTEAGAVSPYNFIPLEVAPVQFQLGVMYEQHFSVNYTNQNDETLKKTL